MLGLRAVIQMAEQRIYAEAPQGLSPARLREMEGAAGSALFVAGNYPGVEWRKTVGFEPDSKRHYQVTIGIAVEPGFPPNLVARAFVSRDPSDDLCHIIWNP